MREGIHRDGKERDKEKNKGETWISGKLIDTKRKKQKKNREC